jgi:hypothetical protein
MSLDTPPIAAAYRNSIDLRAYQSGTSTRTWTPFSALTYRGLPPSIGVRKCEGRRSHREMNPELVALVKRLRRRNPKTGERR